MFATGDYVIMMSEPAASPYLVTPRMKGGNDHAAGNPSMHPSILVPENELEAEAVRKRTEEQRRG